MRRCSHSPLFAASAPTSAPIEAWTLDALFAPFRMPLMVFLSGLLVAPSLARGWRRYLKGKLSRVACPYAVWGILATVTAVIWSYRDGFVHRLPVAGPWEPLRLLYDPPEHL